MLDTLANSGAEIDDTPFILKAQETMRSSRRPIERGIDSGEIAMEEVFDREYRLIEGSNPQQYDLSPLRFRRQACPPDPRPGKARDERLIGSAITDVNGYLPTHLSERSHEPGPDPLWNDAHCRNKRILMDDTTAAAIVSEKPPCSRPIAWSLARSSSP